MAKIKKREMKQAIIFSVALHLLVGGILVLLITTKPQHPHYVVQAPEEKVRPIKAVAVDEKAVVATMAQLKKQAEEKQALEHQHQQQLIAAARAAEKKRQDNEKKLTQLKQQQGKILKAEKIKAEALKEKVAQMKKQAAALAKKNQQEQARLAAIAKQRAMEKAKQQLAEQKAAEQQHKAQLAEEARLRSQTIARYTALIRQAISAHWQVDKTDNQLTCVLLITLSPDGVVQQVTLARGSGDDVLDRSAQAAVYKASPLPMPDDPDLRATFHEIRLTLKPQAHLA